MNAGDYLREKFLNQPSMADYLVNFNYTKRYIYVETPKVACTEIKRVLQLDANGGVHIDNVHDRTVSPLLRVSEDLDKFIELDNDPRTFKFCFVINPFTRALSCYLDKMMVNEWERNRLAPQLGLNGSDIPSFEKFLKSIAMQPEEKRDIHWATQTYLLRPDRYFFSYIGRFENFSIQFEEIKRKLEITVKSKSASSHATGASKLVDDYMSDEAKSLIYEIYGDDFRNFGYGWSIDVLN